METKWLASKMKNVTSRSFSQRCDRLLVVLTVSMVSGVESEDSLEEGELNDSPDVETMAEVHTKLLLPQSTALQ